MLRMYRILTIIAAPLLKLLLWRRLASGKEDAARIAERSGIAAIVRPAGRLIWVHGASVGEAISALPLIRRLLDFHADAHVLLTTGTVTSARIMAQQLPVRALHQFAPLDHPASVRKFLDHWRPDAAIWIESELWPNLILETTVRNIPMALVNARMSEKSFQRWQLAPRAIAKLLSCFRIVLAHDENSTRFFRSLGAAQAICAGDLKQAAEPLPADDEELATLLAAIGSRPVWLAASTHPGEEMIVKEVHEKLRGQFPQLLTIIAPRHADRGPQIKTMLSADRLGGLAVAQRSKNELPSPDADIYLADTMGEMGLIYRLSKIVFMGGSLVAHGGQNPLEPARLGCAIIYGPNVGNFITIYNELTAAGAAKQIYHGNDLMAAVTRLLQEPRTAMTRGLAGKAYTLKGRDKVLEHIIDALSQILPKPG